VGISRGERGESIGGCRRHLWGSEGRRRRLRPWLQVERVTLARMRSSPSRGARNTSLTAAGRCAVLRGGFEQERDADASPAVLTRRVDEPGFPCAGSKAPPHHLVRDEPSRPGAVLPAPIRRRRCGPRTPTRLQSLGLAHWPSGAASGSAGSGEIRRLVRGPRRSRLRRSGGLPALPSAPPLRCPGAVTPRAVRLVARSQPRPLPRLGGRSIASHQPACDTSVRRPVGGPLARPLATPRVLRGHLPLVQNRDIPAERGGQGPGEIGERGWRRFGAALWN
jgi:hypothetical protein